LLSATTALLRVDAAVQVQIELRCDGASTLLRDIQFWRTSNHSVAVDGVTDWVTSPASVATKCNWQVDPRGVAAAASAVVTAPSDSIGEPSESTDVRLVSCFVEGVDVVEPHASTFPLDVAPSVTAFDVQDVDGSSASVTFDVTASGVDRCEVAGVEAVRSSSDQRTFRVSVPSTVIAAGVKTPVRARCRLATEEPAESENTHFLFRGDITQTNLSSFDEVADGPVIVFGTINFRLVQPSSTNLVNGVTFLVGSILVEGVNNGSTCAPATTLTVSVGQVRIVTGEVRAIDVFDSNDGPCPVGFRFQLASVREIRGRLAFDQVGFDSAFSAGFPELRHVGSLFILQAANARGINFARLETVGGDLTVRTSPGLESFSAPLLTSIGGNALISDMDLVRTVRLPALTSVQGRFTVTLDTVEQIDLSSLALADSIVLQNNFRLTTLDLSSLVAVGSGDPGDRIEIDNSAASAPAGATFRISMPDVPAIVDGDVLITDNRKITQEAALAVAAKLDNSASSFPAPTVTNNRP
jgi:hypothetical protein